MPLTNKSMSPDPQNETSVFDTVEPTFEYASTAQRLLHFIIDTIISYVLVMVVILAAMVLIPSLREYVVENAGSPGFYFWDKLITTLLIVMVYIVIEGSTKGKTVGKFLTRTRTVQEFDLSPITWKQVIIRSFSRMVPFDVLSAVSGYPWHDKWSKTIVIKTY